MRRLSSFQRGYLLALRRARRRFHKQLLDAELTALAVEFDDRALELEQAFELALERDDGEWLN